MMLIICASTLAGGFHPVGEMVILGPPMILGLVISKQLFSMFTAVRYICCIVFQFL